MSSLLDLDLATVKSYLTVEHTADDLTLELLTQRAEGRCQQYLARALRSRTVTETFDGGGTTFHVQHLPLDPATPVVVTDTHGNVDGSENEVLSADHFRTYPDRGAIVRVTSRGYPDVWEKGYRRWLVTYTGGLEYDPEWATIIRPDLQQSVLDLVADWYENRNPSAMQEAQGGGVSTTLRTAMVPPRVLAAWDAYRIPWSRRR